jgi:hypothetical protein
MKHPSRRRASTVRRFRNACAEPDEHARQGDAKFTPSERAGHHALPFAGVFRSIFGAEKIERLLVAVRFSCGDGIFHRINGRRHQIGRFGLLLVLVFLQSLFIALDYLPVTLEILGRDRSCIYMPMPADKPISNPAGE